MFAAALFGGAVSGAAVGSMTKGVVVVGSKIGQKITATAATGRMSAVLEGTKRIIMMPFLEGAETGAINLGRQSFKRLKVDWEHIFSGHKAGGSRVMAGSPKTLFPDYMSENAIKRAVRMAYTKGKRVGTQFSPDGGEIIIIQGRAGALKIRIYFNRTLNLITIAFPIFD